MEFTPELPRKETKDLRIVPKLSKPAPSLEESFKAPVESHKQLHELRLNLARENKGTGGEHRKNKKTDGFEPFINPGPTNNPLFLNGYIGHFAQHMELNRKGVEQLLKIAHLDGQVVLAAFAPFRKSSSEQQGKELVAKWNRLIGDKIEENEKDNPYHRVVPVPEGWRIEINDTRIIEELEKKKPTEEKLKRDFVKQFNEQLKRGIWESVWKEKLTTVKDSKIKGIMPITLLLFGGAPTISLISGSGINAESIGALFLSEGIASISTAFIGFLLKLKGDPLRHYDARWEYFMPLIEVDKIARSFSYLSFKGSNLVREKKGEK